MGVNYLWDTNTVIYYLQNNFPASGEKFIDYILDNYQPAISVITEIELLCWVPASEKDIILINSFISKSIVYQLDIEVKLMTIEVRKQTKLKLPDAIIAATALVKKNVLISHDLKDFKKVTSLNVVSPFSI